LSSVTSVGTGSIRPSGPEAATPSSAAARRPASTTDQPSRASASALAAPIPLPAPVTTATPLTGPPYLSRRGTVASMRYRERRWRRPPRYSRGNDSCWRDACLLETGCCIGEAISDNCLLASILLLPQFATAMLAGRRGHRPGVGALVGAI